MHRTSDSAVCFPVGAEAVRLRAIRGLRRLVVGLLLVAVPLVAVPLAGQADESPPMAVTRQMERAGLEVAWTAQAQLDGSRGELHSIHLQVLGIDSAEWFEKTAVTVFLVNATDRTTRFSELDLGRGGQPIGVAEARRRAEKQVILWSARGLKPELSEKRVPRVVAYVQSTNGTLEAIDGENGATLWTVTFGELGHPALKPAANDRYVASIRGSRLYLRERESGKPVWDKPLQVNPILGVSMSDDLVFVPSVNGQIEAYWLPDTEPGRLGTPPWIYSSGGTITGLPAVTPNVVAWPTELGRLYVAQILGAPNPPSLAFRLSADGPIYGEPAVWPPTRSLYTASHDGFVYGVDEQAQRLKWSVTIGDAIGQGPVALPDAVLVIGQRHHLYALSPDDGQAQWVAPNIGQVLAASKLRIYTLDQLGRLRVLDRKTGKTIDRIATGGFDRAVVNRLTDRVYLATVDGRLECLRETGADWPAVHRPLPEAKSADGSVPDGSTPQPAATPAVAIPRASSPAQGEPSIEPPENVFSDDPFAEPPADEPPADEPPPRADQPPADEPPPAQDDPFATDDDPFQF